MDDDVVAPQITTELIAEFGDVLPPTLITSTVEAAATCAPAYPDEPDLRARAREDVSALAEATRRSPGG